MNCDQVTITLLDVPEESGPASIDSALHATSRDFHQDATSDVGTLDTESLLSSSSPCPPITFEHPTAHRDPSQPSIELYWRNLGYSVPVSSGLLRRPKKRHLIKNLTGSLRSGELTALIGPSGAGKTTLIECLAGRRRQGVEGDVGIKYRGYSKSQIKIAYYSQHDSLSETLTVEESLYYAARLRKKNRDSSCGQESNKNSSNDSSCDSEECEKFNINNDTSLVTIESDKSRDSRNFEIVKQMLEELNLVKCAKVPVSRCSGGQRRRLSIALELIFSPSILILDEPTSGLDSLSTLQCVAMLKKLATARPDRQMLIAASIHQPTAKVMSLFDWLYIISFNGQCIYNGPSSALVETLSRFGLRCPQYHNPADFVVEIAAGELGTTCIDQLAVTFAPNKQTDEDLREGAADQQTRTVKIRKIVDATKRHSLCEQIRATAILTQRTFLQSLRDPTIYFARGSTIIACILLLMILYKDDKVGRLDGCARRPNRTTWEMLQNLEELEAQQSFYGNFGFLFFSVVLTVFLAILPTLLSFPLEVGVFIKENSNGWYSLKSYYIARSVTDLPPVIIFPILYSCGAYFITEQFFEWHRFIGFNLVLVLVSLIGHGVGALVSAFFVNNINTSTVVGAIVNIPLFLFAGLLIRIASIPAWFQPLTYISYFRLAFESLLVIIYGMNRCPEVEPISFTYMKEEFGDQIVDMFVCISDFSPTAVDNITSIIDSYNEHFLVGVNEASSSHALKYFNYNDNVLWYNSAFILLYIVVLRVLAYIVLKRKTTVK